MKFLTKVLSALVVLATIAVGVMFALQNKAAVPLDVLIYTFGEQSLALWLLLAFTLGGALGMLMSSAVALRLKARLGLANRRLLKANTELDRLRTVGLKDGE